MRMLLAFLLAPVLVLIALLCMLVIIVPTELKRFLMRRIRRIKHQIQTRKVSK